MRDGSPGDEFGGRDIETERIAGVAVPTTCSDRIDESTLAAAVEVLDKHNATEYAVSPVGGLKVRVGVHRPSTVHRSLFEGLEDISDTVTDHGTKDGFRRLRVDVTVSPDTNDSESGDG